MADSRGRFVWYELLTTDTRSAKSFYSDVMGWDTREASLNGLLYGVFTTEGTAVTGMMELPQDARRAGATPHWTGYVAVDDVDAAVARLERLGGTVHVRPLDISGVGRFAVVADPQSATLALVRGAQADRYQSAPPGALGRVGWHELLAADWEKAFDFYQALFGWQKSDSHVGAMGTYQQFCVGSDAIGGMFTKPASLPLPFWLYYFNVGDIAAAAKRVEAGGGSILYGPLEAPGGAWIAHCTDPQGVVFALIDKRRRKAIGYYVAPRNRPGRTSQPATPA